MCNTFELVYYGLLDRSIRPARPLTVTKRFVIEHNLVSGSRTPTGRFRNYFDAHYSESNAAPQTVKLPFHCSQQNRPPKWLENASAAAKRWSSSKTSTRDRPVVNPCVQLRDPMGLRLSTSEGGGTKSPMVGYNQFPAPLYRCQ